VCFSHGFAIGKRRLDAELRFQRFKAFLVRSGCNELFLGRNARIDHAGDQGFPEFACAQDSDPLVLEHARPSQ
jgi:hypothetical protein